MSAYFFNVSKEEKNNILDQHKKVYDGFVTTYGQQINQQPLYVQDYANDKGGIVVNNKGDVKNYSNMNINESDAFTGAKYLPDISFDFGGPDDEFEGEYEGFDGLDMIGDSESDMEHGTFDEKEPNFNEMDTLDIDEDIEEEKSQQIQEQVNKTLNMFKRFKQY
jgi:hypothetical protein